MFSRATKPMGVIHVVSWGYDWIWEKNRRHAVSRELLAREGQLDLEKLREKSLDREFEHFSEVCGLLKGAWAQKPPGVWLIIAVTKCDLYWPGIDKAKDYYVPDSDSDKSSRFRGRLSRLVKSLHQGGLSQLAVLPVSCAETPFDFSEATDDFDFPTEIYTPPSSELKQAQRQALVNRLQTTIGEFNARR